MRNFLKESAEVEITELEHKVKLIGKILTKCAATLAVSKVYATIAGDKKVLQNIANIESKTGVLDDSFWYGIYTLGLDLHDLKVASEYRPVMVNDDLIATIDQQIEKVNSYLAPINQIWDKLRKQEFEYQDNPESSSVTTAIVGYAKNLGAKLAKCTGALKLIILYCKFDEEKHKTLMSFTRNLQVKVNKLWKDVDELASKAFESISIGGHFTTDQIDEIRNKIRVIKDLVNKYEHDAIMSWNNLNQYETDPIGNYNEV